ncbi:MAG: NrtA/SsuA/CpmA family ABC transporter substrate-binding protein [Candidatus Thiodiazotropha sp.]
MKKPFYLIISSFILCALSIFAYYQVYHSKSNENVSYAMLSSAMIDAISIIGGKTKLWDSEVQTVTTHKFPTGADTVKALSSRQVDFATLAGWPFILATERDSSLRVVATITKAYSLGILANKEKGINELKDLQGKKIGVSFGTTGQFVLETYLNQAGIENSQYERVALKPQEMLSAYDRGDIDAISTWQPFLQLAENNKPNSSILVPGSQMFFKVNFLLVSYEDYLEKNPEKTKKLLSGLLQVSQWIKSNKVDAMRIYMESSGMKASDVDQLWPLFEFEVSLDRSLLNALESQESWGLVSGSIKNKKNWRQYIFSSGLEQIAPERVNMH